MASAGASEDEKEKYRRRIAAMISGVSSELAEQYRRQRRTAELFSILLLMQIQIQIRQRLSEGMAQWWYQVL